MPKFLEQKLKREYGSNSSIPYKIMNARGLMHGNKETAKGAAMQLKHNAKVKAGSSGPKPGHFPKPGRPVKTTPQAAVNQWGPPRKSAVKRAPFGGKAAPLFKAKAAKTPKERYPDAHAMDWRDNQ